MTEATGKGNCMFSHNKITPIPQSLIPFLLILISVALCPPYSHAQQQTEEPGETPADVEASDSRHIERLGEAGTDEWEMDLALPPAAPQTPANGGTASLPDTEQDQVLQQLLSELAANPGNGKVLAQLNTLLADVLGQANELIDGNSADQAAQLLAVIQTINPELGGLKAAQKRLRDLGEIAKLVLAGNAALEEQRVIEPPKDNALYYFDKAVLKDPDNSEAQQGLARVQEALILRASEYVQDLDFETAEYWLQQASDVRENQSPVDEAWAQLAAFKDMHADDLEARVLKAMDAGKYSLADFNIIDLIALGGQEDRVEILREKLEDARFYGGFEPGQIIRDAFLENGGHAPDIVVIPSGSFLMGSNEQSADTRNSEQPRHRVTIARGFGLGVREVTVEEFGLFIERSGYQTAADREGGSKVYDEANGRLGKREGTNWKNDYRGKRARPKDPVLHVNLYDARAYVRWLAAATGKRYRLPSEAEYEYAARAAGSSTYWWGEGSPAKTVENLTGSRDKSPSQREWTTPFNKYGDGHWGPSPAGSLEHDELIHPMGVFDIAGNVCEWVEDCWHPNYIRAPVDGSAWVNPGCTRNVVRGGYWASAPEQSRAATRIAAKPETLGPVVGIRIARDL